MAYRNHIALLCAAALAGASAAATELSAIEDITTDHIGEFVTLQGSAAGYFQPPEERTPYAFNIRDKNGQTIRVVAWPDIFENVKDKTLLQTTGTSVFITAQVAEHSGKLELHLQDWEELIVSAATSDTLSHPSEKVSGSTPAPVHLSTDRETAVTTIPAVTGTNN